MLRPLRLILAALSAAMLLAGTASATSVAGVPAPDAVPPVPEPGFLEPVPAGPCTYENEYEKTMWTEGRYGDKCERLKFAYGPIVVRPGQNDGILAPVVIEKPTYPGAIVRFKPDLVDATGEAPPIENVHLHHGTWLGQGYGNGPFFAAGEEKTIFHYPDGYGMYMKPTDTWLLLYMVHNAVATPTTVWVTWDVDFVKQADAEELGIVPVRPIWLDVMAGDRYHPEGTPNSANPVFNVHKGFGHYSEEFGRMVCEWPRENCARHDVYGDVTAQQGKTVDKDGNPIVVPGTDETVSAKIAGTLVQIGGHLHPGGIRDRVSLVREIDGVEVEKDIFYSDGLYWDRSDPTKGGGPLDTWDFSMTTTGAQQGWKVKIREGDKLRLNATIDSEVSWYEGMGIVMALVAPEDPIAPAGVDVFEDPVEITKGVPTTAIVPEGADPHFEPTCTNDLTGATKTLCLGGQVTHGHLPEASTFGGCPPEGCPPLTAKDGRLVEDIFSTAFTYGEADLAVIDQTGIPLIKKGEVTRFWNPDTAGDIWHTFTRCKEPCNGTYGLNYPQADGGRGGPDDHMDFDSTEIGYGLTWSPASAQINGHKSTEEKIRDGVVWEFTPTETGTFTFWCRIHPGMRGAFKVVE